MYYTHYKCSIRSSHNMCPIWILQYVIQYICISLFAFHSMHFNVCIPRYTFHSMHFTQCISLYAFHFMHFTLCISLYAFHSMHFTVCISLCAFQSMHFTLYFSLYIKFLTFDPMHFIPLCISLPSLAGWPGHGGQGQGLMETQRRCRKRHSHKDGFDYSPSENHHSHK